MCGGSHDSASSNSTENYSQSGTSTTTPNTPSWLAQPWQDFVGKVGQLPDYSVNGPSSLQTEAFNGASGLSESPYFAQGAGLISSGANGYQPAHMSAAQIGPTALAGAASAAPGISTYMNPFTSDVAATTLQQMRQALGIAQNSVGQDAELAGGYGGSRQGVAQALTNKNFLDTAGNVLSNLNLQGFNTALGAANSDADRQQQTNLTNAGAINTQNIDQAQLQQGASGANQTADNTAWQHNVDNLLTAGGLLGNLGTASGTQQLQQLGLLGDFGNTQYNIGQAQTEAPYTGSGLLAQLLGQVPSNLFVGQTTNSNQTGTGTANTNSTDTKFGGNVGFKFGPFQIS